ncbi:MAG: monovalent cation/H(+) antiporter subunit G [Gemmatimonadota bacterium]
MMDPRDVLTVLCVLLGAFFFFAGTLGVLRFPDAITRLHAVTKADNLGLGLVVLGLALQAASLLAVLKLLLIWAIALLASATSCFLVADSALRGQGERESAG